MGEQPMGDFKPPASYNDPSANLWSTYLSKSEQHDRTMAENWKSDMDSILIFAGLFSASLTAFIVESYKTLNPDPNTATAFLLGQLLLSSNTTITPDLSLLTRQFDQTNFTAPLPLLLCNLLWFTSLAFSLICALSATLVEQWTRQYLQASTSKPAPQDRARMSAYLNEGIRKYKMSTIVEIIPLLLHVSLFLFLTGLVFFLSSVNTILQYLILALLVSCCLLYLSIILLPVLDLSCPYWTPLSSSCFFLFRRLNLLTWHDIDGNPLPAPPHISTARELTATSITHARDARDLHSMAWTLRSLREDAEFETFVEVVPGVVAGFDYSVKWLLLRLMNHADISVRLGHRIPGLLATCCDGIGSGQLMNDVQARKRAVTCLNAIWALAMLSIPSPRTGHGHEGSGKGRANVVFRGELFDLIAKIRRTIPAISTHTISTSVVVARSLLDAYVERATAMEEEIIALLESDPTCPRNHDAPSLGSEPGWFNPATIVIDVTNALSNPAIHESFKSSLAKIHTTALEFQLASTNLTRAMPYALLEGWMFHLSRVIALAGSHSKSNTHTLFGSDKNLLLKALHSVKSLQTTLNQAGLDLALQFLQCMLHTTPDNNSIQPHEAFNTLRRAFFRIDFGMRGNPRRGEMNVDYGAENVHVRFSVDSQERLVAILEEAVGGTISTSLRHDPSPHAQTQTQTHPQTQTHHETQTQTQQQTQTQTQTRLPPSALSILFALTSRALSCTPLIRKAIRTIETYAQSPVQTASANESESVERALRDLENALEREGALDVERDLELGGERAGLAEREGLGGESVVDLGLERERRSVDASTETVTTTTLRSGSTTRSNSTQVE